MLKDDRVFSLFSSKSQQLFCINHICDTGQENYLTVYFCHWYLFIGHLYDCFIFFLCKPVAFPVEGGSDSKKGVSCHDRRRRCCCCVIKKNYCIDTNKGSINSKEITVETCSPVPRIKFKSDVHHFVYRLPKGRIAERPQPGVSKPKHVAKY